jgi:hypothetical protein
MENARPPCDTATPNPSLVKATSPEDVYELPHTDASDLEMTPGDESTEASKPVWVYKTTKIDPERIIVEPELGVMYNSITPFTRISAGIWDFANRRWYELNVEREVEDEDWLEGIVRHHIDTSPVPFNVISIDKNGEVTLRFRDDVGTPISGMIEYYGSLPTTSLTKIRKRKHLSGRVDTCEWEGQTCAYKCIDYREDIPRMERELQTREVIKRQSRIDQHGVAPILAVVVDPATQYLDGILLPLHDHTLEAFAVEGGSISLLSLCDLLKTLNNLHRIGITHGDICGRNIVVVSVESKGTSLVLIDFGEIAHNYEGDIKAAGTLLLWCAEHFEWSQQQEAGVRDAALCLRNEDFDGGLSILASCDGLENQG